MTHHSQIDRVPDTICDRPRLLVTKKNAAMSKALQIKAETLSADTYRLFGQVIGVEKVQVKIVNDRFCMGTITMKCQPFCLTDLYRHIKGTQALIPLGGKACLVAVAQPTVNLNSSGGLTQVKAFINDRSLGVSIGLGTWHMALLPLASEMRMVNIQSERAGEDIEERAFEEMFNTMIEVVL